MYLVGVSLTVPSRSCLFSQFYFVNIQCFAGNSLVQFNIISSSDQMRASMLVSSQLPGRRMRCRITIRRRCAVSFVSQQVGAVFESNSLPRLHAHQRFSFLHSVSCSNLLFRRKIKFLVLKMFYSSVRNQRDLSRVEKIGIFVYKVATSFFEIIKDGYITLHKFAQRQLPLFNIQHQ